MTPALLPEPFVLLWNRPMNKASETVHLVIRDGSVHSFVDRDRQAVGTEGEPIAHPEIQAPNPDGKVRQDNKPDRSHQHGPEKQPDPYPYRVDALFEEDPFRNGFWHLFRIYWIAEEK